MKNLDLIIKEAKSKRAYMCRNCTWWHTQSCKKCAECDSPVLVTDLDAFLSASNMLHDDMAYFHADNFKNRQRRNHDK